MHLRHAAQNFRPPRGASAQVKQAGRELVAARGPEILRSVAKVHFKTASEIAPETYPAPPPREFTR